MSALKTGAIANNRFAVIIERHHKHLTEEIPVDRSGGGLWRHKRIWPIKAVPFGANLWRVILLTNHFVVTNVIQNMSRIELDRIQLTAGRLIEAGRDSLEIQFNSDENLKEYSHSTVKET